MIQEPLHRVEITTTTNCRGEGDYNPAMKHRWAVTVVLLLASGPLSGQALDPPSLNNADLVRLATLGVSERTLLALVKEAKRRDFDVTPAGIRGLNDGHVPVSVVDWLDGFQYGWFVVKGSRNVMWIDNAPGPLQSTAERLPPAPRSGEPFVAPQIARNPFVTAKAYDSNEEGRIGEILRASQDFNDFIARLEAGGYTLTANHTNRH